MTNIQLIEIAKKAAKAAGKEIIEIYETGDFSIEAKEDNSPLTIADQAAHNIIIQHLKETNLPVLSEEGRDIPYSERSAWNKFWMVDPLDGTKEFIKKNGEFTVNIALIENQKPIHGVVYAPVLDKMYFTTDGGASMLEGEVETKLNSNPYEEIKNIVASRSHKSPETEEVLAKYPNAKVLSMGSSLKFMLLAEGKAQLYPRFAPTMEWDTAAAHAVLSALNYSVKNPEGQELRYNKENLLNPFFVAKGMKG
ncbi:3'(2'),5'-bisphosphate nucleotidase CysQ [Luteibaculum oceani]|uniref:3'(2'),5'-bisphosphate nucleotidase CysQ n=1 Tax=Luteibaculum oceani TaxID=1294296 RepID=A0A5C6V9M6_9FLAO|nr:3'(2'),5'-bisphosphate nucleotidase CysQ [Luteibaculum oceani]TXC81424.1 3'(2'),5'-bisphosphate nucleotidase CysQ [Luteibaculum oceani]